MTREEYRRALATLVARGNLTPEEASGLLAMYDAGEIDPDLLPLPAGQALVVPDANDDDDRLILLLLLALLAQQGGSRVSRIERLRLRDDLRQGYMDRIAPASASEPGNVAAWHAGQMETISGYIRRQAWAGSGAPEMGIDVAGVQAATRKQLAYLYYWAALSSARALLGRPPSQQHQIHRARLYQGAGWAQWFRQDEAATREDYLVYRYHALDDPSTCEPCSGYNGRYFLPGQGVYPGEVCDGGGYCRCERIPERNEEIWRQLTGQGARVNT